MGAKSRGFRYLDASGRAIRDPRVLARIEALRVPPAWREVHIANSPRAAVQAWGIDARGRKQYRYHERAVATREARKYYRVRRLARELPRVRDALYAEMAEPGFTKRRVAAAVVRLISKGFLRVGSERYLRENRTYGVTTLRKRHLAINGDTVRVEFVGKGNKPQRHVVTDRALARVMTALLRTPGPRLFRYRDESGWCNLTERDVNEFVQQLTGKRYTAKDFRTWGGTLRMATVLSDLGPARTEREARKNVTLALRLVSAELGNTPAICRASYVHPMVIARYLDAGETIVARAVARRRQRAAHYPEERALIRFLDRHFPERRRKIRREELVAA